MKNTDGGLCQLQLSLSPDFGKPGETAIQTVLEGQRYLALVLVSLLTGSSEDLQTYMDVCNGYWVRKRLMKSFLGKLSSLMRCWLGHRTSLSNFFSARFSLSFCILRPSWWDLGITGPFHLFLCLYNLCLLTGAVTSSWGGL